ncbi:hypothetical protein [Streptomyces griseochromogenes]|uniref:hypothetical protein n=1 Tax=Streptomyces griseochromogenes TaxID=68214 RepID=UPI003797994A
MFALFLKNSLIALTAAFMALLVLSGRHAPWSGGRQDYCTSMRVAPHGLSGRLGSGRNADPHSLPVIRWCADSPRHGRPGEAGPVQRLHTSSE